MPNCNRCGELKLVVLYDDCKVCGPTYLCASCRNIHLQEILQEMFQEMVEKDD
jgi:hypothetical protein